MAAILVIYIELLLLNQRPVESKLSGNQVSDRGPSWPFWFFMLFSTHFCQASLLSEYTTCVCNTSSFQLLQAYSTCSEDLHLLFSSPEPKAQGELL